MAIAFDNSALKQQNAATSASWTHTVTGSNTVGIMGVTFAAGTDVSGTPTWNGVNMTLLLSLSVGGATFDKSYLYYIVNPGTGTITVNNTGGANYIYCGSLSYTGVDQTTPVDASGTGTATGTSITKSLTTTIDNDWLVSFFVGATGGLFLTAGTNTALRVNSGGSWNVLGDSNAAETPAGSFSQACNASGSETLGALVMSIVPVGGVPAAKVFPLSNLLLMGV